MHPQPHFTKQQYLNNILMLLFIFSCL